MVLPLQWQVISVLKGYGATLSYAVGKNVVHDNMPCVDYPMAKVKMVSHSDNRVKTMMYKYEKRTDWSFFYLFNSSLSKSFRTEHCGRVELACS